MEFNYDYNKVRHSGGSVHFVIIRKYSQTQNRDAIEIHMLESDAILDKLNGPVIIIGDFNARFPYGSIKIQRRVVKSFISRLYLFV